VNENDAVETLRNEHEEWTSESKENIDSCYYK